MGFERCVQARWGVCVLGSGVFGPGGACAGVRAGCCVFLARAGVWARWCVWLPVGQGWGLRDRNVWCPSGCQRSVGP